MCVLTPDKWHILDRDQGRVEANVQQIDWDVGDSDKGDFEHHMLKEIYEQPEALENAMRGRLDDSDSSAHFGGLNLDTQQLRRADRLILTACGTSYHAAMVGEYLIEEFARMPVEVEYASEFRYRNPPIDRNTIVLAITQSGETADTQAALRESKRKGHPTLAICNVVGSTIAREADGGVYLHAGPEIGVASTKAFTSQIVALALLGLFLGRQRGLSLEAGRDLACRPAQLPGLVDQALALEPGAERIAREFAGAHGDSAAAARLPHRGVARVWRGPAAQPGEKCDSRISGTGERGAVPSVAAAGTAPCSPLLFSVKIGSSDGQNSRTGSVTVPM